MSQAPVALVSIVCRTVDSAAGESFMVEPSSVSVAILRTLPSWNAKTLRGKSVNAMVDVHYVQDPSLANSPCNGNGIKAIGGQGQPKELQ
jgi:hypothetical protein